MKMSFPCKRHAIFRKTRDRSRSETFTRKGVQVPQEIEPRLPKNIKGTLPITAQTSKSHFQRDRCGFRKSTCRSNGKLIFEVAANHLGAKASPGAISQSVLAFFRWKKPNTVQEIAPGGVLPPRLKRAASKMSFPCTRHVDFPKTRKWDFAPKKGVQLPLENDPGSDRGSQRKPQINEKSLRESPGRPMDTQLPPNTPKAIPGNHFASKRPPRISFCLPFGTCFEQGEPMNTFSSPGKLEGSTIPVKNFSHV
jgi:hypothetical protein